MSGEQKEIVTLSKEINNLSNKIQKLQQNRNNELELLTQYLSQTNKLLAELIQTSQSGSTVASGKKYIPFHTGSVETGQLVLPPENPDDYPTQVDVYAINNSRIIPHMTLINDGPGEIFFITAYAKSTFNAQEGHLNVNDQRELFNVYEIRLRSTLPLTTFRLIEGIFRTGSFAPNTKANTEIRPTVQSNEKLKNFTIQFDIDIPITITVPTTQTFNVDPTPLGSINQPPLPPGTTAALVDAETFSPMPFTIPEGYIIETFAVAVNLSTDYTLRSYFEFIPGFFTRVPTFPGSNRGSPVNEILNLSFYNSQGFDPTGAPQGGRRFLLTVTNDDPFNSAVGDIDFIGILKRLS